MPAAARPAWTTLIALAAACGDPEPDVSVEGAGPAPVGTARWTANDAARSRTLVVQAWYPATQAAAATAAAGFPVEELEDEPNRTAYRTLLAAADPTCPTRTAHAERDAMPAVGPHPVVVFSHCHECTRFSGMTIAERLASWGFVVLAVDHTDNTLWDRLDDTGVPLSSAFLEVRAADVRFVLDRALAAAGAAPEVPAALAATLDATRVGVVGHSFGAVTAGRVAETDDRVDAAIGLASPFENPFIAGVTLAAIDVPMLFLVAKEDNSITEIGNDFIRDNFAEALAPAWKVEVADAGHWSVSDVVGVIEGFAPGCGVDERQTDGMSFTYLDPAAARALAAAYVTAFFRATLEGDGGARAYLTSNRPEPLVTSESHD